MRQSSQREWAAKLAVMSCTATHRGEENRTFNNKFLVLESKILHSEIKFYHTIKGGRDSSFGATSRYGLDGPGIESRSRGEIFRIHPDRLWAHPAPI
jgi:hypothetical protein